MRAQRFLEKFACTPCRESPWKLQRHLVRLLAIFWKQIANGAHRSVSGILSTTYSCWQLSYEQIWNLFCNVAMNILSPDCCYSLLATALKTLFNISNGAMPLHDIGNIAWTLRKYWQQRYEPCAIMPVAMLGPVLLHWRLFKENGEALFSLWKSRHKCCLCLRRDWKQQFPNLFVAHSQQLYVVNKRPLTNFIPAFATAVWGGVKYLKGSHRMGDGQIFLKPPRHSL